MSALVVWMAGRRVGELIQKANGNLQFRYDADYAGLPVSQALPQQAAAHSHNVTRAVFGGLLPEGDVRAVLADNLGISAGNDYGLLEQVGGDVAGAITLLPEGAELPTDPTSIALSGEHLDRLLSELPQRPLAADLREGIRLSLAGAQPKVPVVIGDDGEMALPTNSAAPTTHILKPEPARFPGLVDNEAFCMALGRACDLWVASVAKDETRSGQRFLIVERYDRDPMADPIRRLHQEDFCQALGLPADRKYQQEGGPTVARCAELIRRCTPVPARELPRLIGALALHWIVGNCDAHAKNYSLLYDRGAPTLAPLYDVVSTVVYPELTTRLAMSIDGARMLDEIDARSWTKLAGDAGVRPAFVTRTVDHLRSRAATEAATLIRTSVHDNDTARQINDRIQRFARR